MELNSTFFKAVKYLGVGMVALTLLGIVTVMVLARGTGEDITGVVAPALLIAILSGAIAILAAILQRKVKKSV